MRIPFRTRPGHEAAVLAEAQALLDSGHDRDSVLAIFAGDAPWLEAMLDTSDGISRALDAEPPSYYFEASLKSRFLEAARERQYRPVPEPTAPVSRVKTAFASGAVLAGTAALATITFGFVTADDAVPGDWNYRFKTTQERVEYALARGDNKVDIQIHQTQARVYEIEVLTKRGNVSPEQIKKLEVEVAELRTQIEKSPNGPDAVQKQQLRALQDLSTVVLNAATEKNKEIEPAATSALTAVNEAVAAGVGGTSTIAIKEPTTGASITTTTTATAASPSASPTEAAVVVVPDSTVVTITEPTSTAVSATPVPPTATPTLEPATPTPTEEPPTATPTSQTPTPEASETPEPSTTAEPSASASPSASATPNP